MSHPPRRLLGTAALATLLVAAPVCDTLEPMLSPLPATDQSSALDVVAISAHQGRFALSVLIGVVGTLLFLPAIVGLMSRTVDRAPIASRVAAAFAVVGFPCFMGIRLGQAIELQGIRDGLPAKTTGGLLDHLESNPIGAPIVICFVLSTVIGLLFVAVAVWRAGLPRPAAVLIGLFGVADVGVAGVVPEWTVHVLLLAGLAWVALALARDDVAVAHPHAVAA